MFVILVYDVNAKRVTKMRKTCEKFLYCTQRSVFEGKITISKLERLKIKISKIIDSETDQCTIYEFESLKYTQKEELGTVSKITNIL